MHNPIPVTVLSGFLGAGKTTLLRHLLKAEHGLKIAVIENEFSDAGIDTQLLGEQPVQVMTLSNGCVCCTIHTDLTKALYLLLERLDSGEIDFDRLVIECTGLADPAPVAQTFFIDEELRERYILDGIITLVDAKHAEFHLTQTIAQAQIGFADRLLVSKRDLVDEATFEALGQRLTRINRRAPIRLVEHGQIDLAELLDVRGFNLNADLGGGLSLRPVSKAPSVDRISSLVLRTEQALDLDRLSEFMNELLEDHGKQLLRYKGVLSVIDEPRRMVFQGVLKLYGFDWDSEWAEGEVRESVMVFIADDLPEEKIRQGFERMLAG
ncbi:GTPase, G3E family [Pseudomonas sp. NFPP10]|uniref:GTP-binding protein YjiA n=1 Tax=Pseudomonas protegens (strain DSM 19095 / LMG 27888 / CFBP 6595 / CHA0) TaxID=1124983 RepID=A0A2C9ETZ6_PSEPH|nr:MULTISPECIES: GTPase [Pseudomonas]AGL87061.1 GTP-binding protein YjiA [Pseudomonas protegens CHA0]MBF0640395.1 GTPase [Pseudomonas protegens]MBP5110194.1 GTPase [Pseudomonas protegens]MDS9878746.1 GTPase [Pseudomonas protegens]NAN52914.1 GTPase [Pseudomonas protegens]